MSHHSEDLTITEESPPKAATDAEVKERNNENRQKLFYSLKRLTDLEIPQSEIINHFVGMPKHYWQALTLPELIRQLRCIHRYLSAPQDSTFPHGPASIDWEDCPLTGELKITICTGDHSGLLSKIAAAFAGLRANINRAEAYTRLDGVVLDTFWVTEPDKEPEGQSWKKHFVFLIEGMLSEPPRFASVWACQAHKSLNHGRRANAIVHFENPAHLGFTMMQVEAWDRLGILSDILQAVSDSGLNVFQAVISTEGPRIRDLFYVTDRHGAKITNRCTLESLRCSLIQSLS
jgi:[protein-PII] uridylyltransferase